MKKKNPKTRSNQKSRRRDRLMTKIEAGISRFLESLPIRRQGEDPNRIRVRALRRAMQKHIQTSSEWKRLKQKLNQVYASIPPRERAR